LACQKSFTTAFGFSIDRKKTVFITSAGQEPVHATESYVASRPPWCFLFCPSLRVCPRHSTSWTQHQRLFVSSLQYSPTNW
jgi:hypothetical protein